MWSGDAGDISLKSVCEKRHKYYVLVCQLFMDIILTHIAYSLTIVFHELVNVLNNFCFIHKICFCFLDPNLRHCMMDIYQRHQYNECRCWTTVSIMVSKICVILLYFHNIYISMNLDSSYKRLASIVEHLVCFMTPWNSEMIKLSSFASSGHARRTKTYVAMDTVVIYEWI